MPLCCNYGASLPELVEGRCRQHDSNDYHQEQIYSTPSTGESRLSPPDKAATVCVQQALTIEGCPPGIAKEAVAADD
jgi:hypothetical protein